MTIVEVLGALVLLGVLASTLLVAQRRFIEQAARAARKQQAVQAAEKLLTLWWHDPAAWPVDRQGALADPAGLQWRTCTIGSADAAALGLRQVRLEILEGSAASPGQVLACVDLVLPQAAPVREPSPEKPSPKAPASPDPWSREPSGKDPTPPSPVLGASPPSIREP